MHWKYERSTPLLVLYLLSSVASARREIYDHNHLSKTFLDNLELFDLGLLFNRTGFIQQSRGHFLLTMVQRFPDLTPESFGELKAMMEELDDGEYFDRHFSRSEITTESLHSFYNKRVSEVLANTLISPGDEILLKAYEQKMAAFGDLYFGIIMRELPRISGISPDFVGFACVKDLETAFTEVLCGRGKEVASFWRFDALSVREEDGSQITHLLELCELEEGRALLRQTFGVTSNDELWLSINNQAQNALRTLHDAGIVHRNMDLRHLICTREGRVQIIGFDEASLLNSTSFVEGVGLTELIDLMERATHGKTTYFDFRDKLLLSPSQLEEQKQEDFAAMTSALHMFQLKLRRYDGET